MSHKPDYCKTNVVFNNIAYPSITEFLDRSGAGSLTALNVPTHMTRTTQNISRTETQTKFYDAKREPTCKSEPNLNTLHEKAATRAD